MATYFVTGGCGFIGSHLVESLVADGHSVRILDDLSTGRRENVPPEAEIVVGDVADAALVDRVMARTAGCFHLAAVASVARVDQNPTAARRINLGGTEAVLDAAVRAGLIPVVYTSSAAVYGDCPALPLKENGPLHPISAYGIDKLDSERRARAAGESRGLPTFGLRPFNVYGPRQDPSSPYSGVISILMDRIHLGRGFEIFGDGEQTRDFVYVADTVRALRAAMTKASPAAPAANVCTGFAISLLDLIRAIESVTGRKLKLRHGSPRAGDIRASVGDPFLARTLLGFSAETSIERGLAAMAKTV